MYTKHFGLNMLPFENVPDPRFFFDEGDHARIHKRIKDSLDAGRGLTIVTGPIGSGKTTLSQMIIADFSSRLQLIWISEPPENSTGLFMFIAQELGLKPESSERVFVIRDIKDALLKITSEGSKCLLIIDESHLMSDEVLNGIRLLNNLEIGSTKLIQILLLGQNEMLEKINRPEMEPFKQRIATLENMGKMNVEKIRKYIVHRLHVAGGGPSIFSDTGWEALLLAFGSENIPRLINSLCDRSLTIAFEREKAAVDVDDVYEAAEGMGLQKEIFFYKIALKKKEKESRPSSPDPDKSVAPTASDTVRREAAPSLSTDSSGIRQESSQPEKERPVWNRPAYGFAPSETDQKSFKMPITLLLLSVAALSLSIIFFCRESGSSNLAACIQELLGF